MKSFIAKLLSRGLMSLRQRGGIVATVLALLLALGASYFGIMDINSVDCLWPYNSGDLCIPPTLDTGH